MTPDRDSTRLPATYRRQDDGGTPSSSADPADRRPRPSWPARLRQHRVTAALLRFAPAAAGVATGTALLDYLPQPLGPSLGRYLAAVAGGIAVASTLAWLAARSGDAGVTAKAGTVRQGPHPTGPTVREILDGTRAGLLASLASREEPEGELLGWHHFLNGDRDERPTAIGTAYGLRTMLALDLPDPRFEQHRIVETLWRLQLPGGGWAARTQAEQWRPEVTAWVLLALVQASAGGDGVTHVTDRLLGGFGPTTDPVGAQRTHVVATVLGALARLAPRDPSLDRLRDLIIAGRIRDPDTGLLCWGDRLGSVGDAHRIAPSMPHTARATISLIRSGRQSRSVASVIEEGLEWLVARGDLTNQTEQIRRMLPGNRRESLVVKHFTAAWVARAIILAKLDRDAEREALLEAAVEGVCRQQSDGIWEWENRERPIWMAYQGITALRLHAMESARPCG